MSPIGAIFMVLAAALAVTLAVLAVIFIGVPLFKGIAWLIVNFFKGVGWFIRHIFEFIFGTISDALRLVGSVPAGLVFVVLTVLNVLIGRWSAAGHFGDSVKREVAVFGACLYRIVLHRPLKLFMLHGLLEGLEQRVPEAMAAAPSSDKPSRRLGVFDGYEIVGSLRGGGSGAKLYVARPDDAVRKRYPGMPERVVIKTFAISEGSSLPQIVRESRALECAKQLGLVFEHGMDDHRFYYVMPYHDGDHLGIVARQLHAQSGATGLETRELRTALGYACDLVQTLRGYHDGGLWHKDVKPENVIVHDGRAHLVDLGLVTPLRSAMTLTTHGTEYFRDPEMVRQALRGVKVHQVNGAKFDIYAAGAVLYFLIENDFPAHGALSRFTRKSPEALKWIVRRAMADYAHRYDSAGLMLADLRAVAEADDPFAVKPAALPSLSGRSAEDDDAFDEMNLADEQWAQADAVANARGAATPNPRPERPAAEAAAQSSEDEESVKGWGVIIGPDGWKVGGFGAGGRQPANAEPAAAQAGRPDLEVTDWWTGRYQVRSESQAGAGADAAMHGHAAALRHDAAAIRHKVREGAVTARKAAREQVKAARGRAKEMRRTVRAKGRHGRHALKDRQPSFMVAFVVLLVVGGLLAITVLPLALMSGRAGRVTAQAQSEYEIAARALGDGFQVVTVLPSGEQRIHDPAGESFMPPIALKLAGEEPYLLVPNLKQPEDPTVQLRLRNLIEQRRKRGMNLVVDPNLAKGDFLKAVEAWQDDKDDPEIDGWLEDLLETNDLYGVVYVTQQGAAGQSNFKLNDMPIYSTRPGAEHRRWDASRASSLAVAVDPPDMGGDAAAGPSAGKPYLIINDHPLKQDRAVAARVDTLIDRFESAGYAFLRDADMEVKVRSSLPAGRMSVGSPLPALFYATLEKLDLGGVLMVQGGAANDNDARTVNVLRIPFVESAAGEDGEDSDVSSGVTVGSIGGCATASRSAA